LHDRSTVPSPTRAELTPSETARPSGGASEATPRSGTRTPKAEDASVSGTKTRLSGHSGPPVPGRILFDKYSVVRQLGEGGMGEVWLVRHLDLDVERALKLIISAVAFNVEHRARFRREARVMAKFSHPNAVAVHDAVVRPDGNTAYIEMEYVRGKSLKDLLESGVPWPLDRTSRIVAQLCDALQVAHEHGIVHRDLKPSNLMLLDGQPPDKEHLKVLDFGIAKILGVDQTDPEGLLSRTGIPLGTPLYMSPEQILAESRSVDGRSDIYAVGIILYELLTGHRAFEGGYHKLIYQHLHTPVTPFFEKNPDVRIPPEVERVVLGCLEKNPDLRPQSARELADEFLRAAAPAITPVGESPRVGMSPRLKRASLALMVVVGLGAGAAWWLRPPSFDLVAAPANLSLKAGDTRTFSVALRRYRLAGPITFSFGRRPDGITITREPDTNPDYAQFRVAADLNARASTTPETLTFRAAAGARSKASSISLKIVPPTVTLPPGCVSAPGARLERVGPKVYPGRVVRVVPPAKLEPSEFGDLKVDFLLIKKDHRTDPDPFYIMENKVWNALFARFIAEKPESAEDNAMWQPIAKGRVRLPPTKERLPATDMTGREAYLCAEWLGGKLPTCEQWDKAAGVFDPGERTGPFVGTWSSGDKTGIAIGRDGAKDGPLPVGTAPLDISPFGCRDMAGNGMEWTRNAMAQGVLVPLKPGQMDLILTRGRMYRFPEPFRFDDLKDPNKVDSWRYGDSSDELGFRVVLEIEAF
jgi:serine/threonine protein kinase/formylglycine-generating enzyme required for sulfatase activity